MGGPADVRTRHTQGLVRKALSGAPRGVAFVRDSRPASWKPGILLSPQEIANGAGRPGGVQFKLGPGQAQHSLALAHGNKSVATRIVASLASSSKRPYRLNAAAVSFSCFQMPSIRLDRFGRATLG